MEANENTKVMKGHTGEISKKDKFIERCYNLKKPFALLLPVSSSANLRICPKFT